MELVPIHSRTRQVTVRVSSILSAFVVAQPICFVGVLSVSSTLILLGVASVIAVRGRWWVMALAGSVALCGRPELGVAFAAVSVAVGELADGAPEGRRRGLAAVAAVLAVVSVAAWPLVTLTAAVGAVVVAGAGGALATHRSRDWFRARAGTWPDTAVGWWLWNFASGGPLDFGPALTEGTRWDAAWARVRVAAPRLAAATAAGGALYLALGAPLGAAVWQIAGYGLAIPLGVGVGIWASTRAAIDQWHYWRWVRPLHWSLHGVLGYAPDHPPRRYLIVPRDRIANGGVVVVKAPTTWAFQQSKNELVEALTIRKLALKDVSAHWEGTAGSGNLQLRSRLHPPTRAFFSNPDIRELVSKAKPSAPLIGVAAEGKTVAFDLDSEAPHLLLSAGTGGGKSAFLRLITAQLMHHGAQVVVIDFKRHSQMWIRGLPGVRYVREVADIHDMLMELAVEGDRRNRAWDDVPLGGKGPQFPRLVVICEELNATFSKLRRYWSKVKTSRDPGLSPAVEGLQDLLFMGRAVQIHVLAIAQQARAEDLGGSHARENFAVRILARYSPQTWNMLAGDIPYQPAPTNPGRVMTTRFGSATETQAVFIDDLEAVEWATSGAAPPEGMYPLGVGPDSQGEHPDTVSAFPLPAPTAAPPTVAITLAEASDDRGRGVVPLRFNALRVARQRDPEFPPPFGTKTVKGGTADTYNPDALRYWHRNRPGTRGVQKPPAEPQESATNTGSNNRKGKP